MPEFGSPVASHVDAPVVHREAGRSDHRSAAASPQCETSRWAVFGECPHCAGEMAPEHAHYRCRSCGWRDSCCD